jgi:hypothetical protein
MVNIICSTGMLCFVVLVSTKILEEHSAAIFCAEDGGSMFLQNVGSLITDCTLS